MQPRPENTKALMRWLDKRKHLVPTFAARRVDANAGAGREPAGTNVAVPQGLTAMPIRATARHSLRAVALAAGRCSKRGKTPRAPHALTRVLSTDSHTEPRARRQAVRRNAPQLFRRPAPSQPIEGTADAEAAAVQHVGVIMVVVTSA